MLKIVSIAATAVLVATSGFGAPDDPPPNIILVVADDIGRDWLSCYGSDHGTPHVDDLAKQGLRYQTVWSTPSGTPTHVTLLTGQYPFRHGWTQQHDVRRQGGTGLSWKRFTTFARVLRDHGYATAIAGQWQLNDQRQQTDALKQHGFDEHCLWTAAAQVRPKTRQRFRSGQLLTNGRRATVAFGPDEVNRFAIGFLQ
ncbi:MAG: sulfatase-like hydrolase/transferase, partial [Planctomycetaceae bacterium]